MKFAMVNEQKTGAQPGLKGNCIYCQSNAITKCGSVKIWHWAHKSKISCDSWWENETEWHRKWKNLFPREWQEKIHIDSVTGEKHIADIKTNKELVIEFQHSAIKSDEIKSREAFYQNMVWVVDGTRLKKDYPRFCKGMKGQKPFFKGFFLTALPGECFPASWLTSSAPVYFDFQGGLPDMQRSALWCLFPAVKGHAVITGVPRDQFIEFSSTAPHLLFARDLLNFIPEYLQGKRKRTAVSQAGYPNIVSRRYARRL
jgi:competence protein CoiA